jgi:hypothetical protein
MAKKNADYVLARDAENNGFGALDLEILSGLDLSADTLLPPAIGAGVAAASSLLIRRYVTNATAHKWAPLIGGVVGVVASIPLKYWKGDAAMQSGAVAALLYGGITQAVEMYNKTSVSGLTMERLSGLTMERLGAIPMLPAGDSMVPSSVRSSVDINAYGRV